MNEKSVRPGGSHRPPPPELSEYPFASHYYPRPDGLELHYVDEGAGPPVVLIHGNPTWSFFYRRLIARLTPAYRCLAPDHLGMGLSSRPMATEYGFRLVDRARDFGLLMDHWQLSTPVHLIVHDWGGPIALAWAGENPDRVASITLLNTGLRFPSCYRLPFRLALFKYLALLGDWLVAQSCNYFARGTAAFGSVKGLTAAVRHGFLAPYAQAKDRLALARFIEDIPLTTTHPSFECLRQIDCNFTIALSHKPLALLWGLQDFVFNRQIFFDWCERLPQAQTLILPEAGHYLLEDEPERAFAFVENFLGGLT
ncbi:MAG: alpha/beta fold hydrolase [Candidatus Adiutrix intracellularis]|jgi:haloalkane dehalogenase|nr:alpha/beta fold hydrolase [Candidatus Adiutrix intracellularis]